jgi:hypothetical protein
MTTGVLTIPCPECGRETVDVFWADGVDPVRAEYHCSCLALVARDDDWSDEVDERGMVKIHDPGERTLAYIEQVKQTALRLRSQA